MFMFIYLSYMYISLFTGNELLSTLFIAVATYQCLYPFVLMVPVAIYFYKVCVAEGLEYTVHCINYIITVIICLSKSKNYSS